MPFNLSQTEINRQERIQEEYSWERRRQEVERERLAKKARLEGEEEIIKRKREFVFVYYCTNLKCLVKLEQLPKGKPIQEKSSKEYLCPSCKEIFVRRWDSFLSAESVRSNSGIEATLDRDNIKRLEDHREKYLQEARELRKKLQFLDEWENKDER